MRDADCFDLATPRLVLPAPGGRARMLGRVVLSGALARALRAECAVWPGPEAPLLDVDLFRTSILDWPPAERPDLLVAQAGDVPALLAVHARVRRELVQALLFAPPETSDEQLLELNREPWNVCVLRCDAGTSLDSLRDAAAQATEVLVAVWFLRELLLVWSRRVSELRAEALYRRGPLETGGDGVPVGAPFDSIQAAAVRRAQGFLWPLVKGAYALLGIDKGTARRRRREGAGLFAVLREALVLDDEDLPLVLGTAQLPLFGRGLARAEGLERRLENEWRALTLADAAPVGSPAFRHLAAAFAEALRASGGCPRGAARWLGLQLRRFAHLVAELPRRRAVGRVEVGSGAG